MRTLDEAVFYALYDIDPGLAEGWRIHFNQHGFTHAGSIKSALSTQWACILSYLMTDTLTIRYHLSDINTDEAWFAHFQQDVLPLVREHRALLKQRLGLRSVA